MKGESIIGIFGEQEQETLAYRDFEKPKFSFSNKLKTISQIWSVSSSKWYVCSNDLFIRAKTSISQQLAHASEKDQESTKKTLDKLIPEHYREYKQIFEKAASERFPERKPWDHAIDLKPDLIPKDCKIYPLTPSENQKMNEFLDENLAKGYIRPSKLPMASPFFFVAKKDALVLWPC